MKKMAAKTRGEASHLLEQRILDVSKSYVKMTVRQLFYVLASKHGYPLTRAFYRLLDYHLTKMRRIRADLYVKFIDTTRAFITPPRAYPAREIWVEKDALRSFLEDLAMKYRIAIQVERGFGSLSMFRDGLIRARERGVKRILYIGDFDPSGLMIELVTGREMSIDIERVALTLDQIRRFNPPSKPVNMKDSRAPDYVNRFGPLCWEVEALDPSVLWNLVESKLKESVPTSFLEEAAIGDKAARIVEILTKPFLQRLQEEAYELGWQGLAEDEIIGLLASKYDIARQGGKR